MTNQELGAARFKVRITGERRCTLYEAIVCGGRVSMCGGTGVVECREYSRGSTFFDEVAYNLVIEIFDRSPFNLFPNIFFLFGFEGQFDKNLLQLFIDIVDAELLERVVLWEDQCNMETSQMVRANLKYFKSEYILSSKFHVRSKFWDTFAHQYTDDMGACGSRFHRNIDP